VLCLACSRCEQCFACVGLQGESYCILNQRYSRKDYFIIVQGLRKRLEEQRASLLSELAAASRGLWTGTGAPTGKFAVTGGGVRAVLDGNVPPPEELAPVDPADEDPWQDGVVPARFDG
jgi:hypothetical protein